MSHPTHQQRGVLHKRTVLITNGSSSLSQALCEQLIETHKCRVALLTTSTSAVADRRTTPPEPESGTLRNVSQQLVTFECNLSDRDQVSTLVTTLEQQLGEPVDLVIYQDPVKQLDSNGTPDQVEHFVEQSSNEILGFVNLLTSFVPSMLRHGGGRIVSLKNNSSGGSSRAFLESQSQYHDLVRSISSSQPEADSSVVDSIHLCTVICDISPQKPQLAKPAYLSLTEPELAQRILQAIESQRTTVQIAARRNLLEFCSSNILQLAAVGLDKLQLRKTAATQKLPLKVQ